MRTNQYDSDEALMRAFQAGEEDAFTAVYYRFNQGLYYFAKRFLGNDEAYDAVADAFTTLWRDREKLDAVPKVERWLFVTVRNYCYSALRRQIRQQDVKTELFHQLEATTTADLRFEEITTELITLLEREIDKLPARQREVFLLSFKAGLKPAEIAARLSLSVKTVKNQKLSAIRLLQAAVGQRGAILCLLVLLHEGAQPLTPA